MLEGLVANLLNRFLGMYVKNFDPKQLNVGIWSGDVKLKNLQLRREALDQLKLPINVVEGHLGELTLSIPWSNLRGKPVKVNIEDVFLLAAPKQEDDYNSEDEEKRAQALKIEKLESAEMLKERNTEGMSQEEQQKNQSFVSSLTTAIVDNLQISIKNVHVRYEDSIACPGHSFAVGLTLKEMSAVSTDGDWRPTFIQSTSDTTHKLAVLNSFGMYWNSDADLFGTGKGGDVGPEAQDVDHDELLKKFRAGIEETAGFQYLLRPVSGRAGIEMDKTGKIDRAKVKARLLFQELGFVLDEDQYRDGLMLVDLMHYFIRHQEYKKNQPEKSPKEDPKAWLRFAGNAVLDKIHDRNRRWSWAYFKERRDDRLRYIELFKKKKKEQKLTEQEQKDITNLEWKSSYEDLRFWRSLARNQLRKENVGVKKQAPKTWSSWVWGSKTEQKQEDGDAGMTEQQRKELYNAIDWDEKKALADSIDAPREAIKLQLESSLRTGSFTLKRDPHGKADEILKLVFDDFRVKALQRTDSFLADLVLGGLRVYDGTTEGSLFPQIVKVKGTQEQPKDKAAEKDDSEVGELSEKQQPEEDEDVEDSLFHLVVENNPLDESADTSLMLKLKSLEFIHNPAFVVEVAKFFKPPERHMESIGALLETAGATVEEIRQQTRAGLEFALEEHKTINAKIDIQAPVIIVPESITQESTICLILDAGHMSLNSELIDKKTIQDIQSKQKQQYTEDDFRQLEGLMYDKFKLKLESTQVLIGPGIEATRAELSSDDDSKNMHIIDKINMDFLLESSIVPKATDITKIRISGTLPVLHASISDRKYKLLMRLLEVAVPKFDSEEPVSNGHVEPPPAKSEASDIRSKRKSVQLLETKDLPIDHESDDEAEQPKPSDDQVEQPANIHQRNFELKFTVEKLQASLYKSDDDESQPDRLLVELIAEHFKLDFYQRPFDMVAEVVLGSLAVDDHIEDEPLPEFKQIISSKGFKAEEGKDLFVVKFVKVNPESPELKSTYEGITTNLDVVVSTINIIVTRRTLLTLLDFVLTTFAGGDGQQAESNSQPQEISVQQPSPDDSTSKNQQSDKIRIKAELTSIALILNNDGVRLATLSLNSGDVGVFLDDGTMQIKARLGSLSLVDDVNQGAPEDSPLRRLVAIEGDDLADFKYQTFNASRQDYPGYDAGIYLRSGSIKVNFMEEPFRKIMEFGVKFGKMQAIMNAARQAAANQASQVQETAQKMHFDIVMKTPIIVFPRAIIGEQPRDLLTAYLGEIYANNKFVGIQGRQDGPLVNKLSAGIRHIRLTTEFHYGDGKSEVLEMIENVDLDFKIRYLEHQPGLERPDLEIEGSMSAINLRVSQTQFKFLMELSKSIPAAFATDDESEEDIAEELQGDAHDLDTTQVAKAEEDQETVPASNQAPEIGSDEGTWTKLNLVFKVPTIGLELFFANEDAPTHDIDSASLSKFSLNETNIKLRMVSDGAMEAELLIHSFTIRDSRAQDTNKFRKIMSLINNDVQQQFMASISMSAGEQKHMIVMLSVDSPRVIVALDYVFAVQSFLSSALPPQDQASVIPIEDPEEDGEHEQHDGVSSPVDDTGDDGEETQSSMTMSFRINVVDAQVILIANPAISNTEAIVLGTKEVLVSQQNATTLQVTKIGMFLCRMDKFETSRLRLLDDFSIQMSMDNRSQGKSSSLTSIHIEVEPLVLRLSLRDILLAMQIVSKATAGMPQEKAPEHEEPKKIKEVRRGSQAPSTKRKSIGGATTIATKKSKRSKSVSQDAQKPPALKSGVVTREELVARVDGIRVVLIGDMHELPLLDWSVKKFDVNVNDWSGAMTADTNFNIFINVYNFSKSAWEPLIEPWQLGFHMSKQQYPEVMSMEIYSHKNMELTVTSATIALASKSFNFLSSDEDMLSKPRVADAPYRVRNYTGFDLSIWADEKSDSAAAAKLTDGEEYPWRFEDATSMREHLSPEGNAGLVGVKLEGSGFDSVSRIPVTKEGETLYNLKPRKDKIQHRMLVEVSLGSDNVKYITFRSPLLVENKTQIPIEIGVFSPEEGSLLKIEKIAPGEGRPAPVGAAFVHSLVVRPDPGFGYSWSNERLFWKELLKRSTRTLTCQAESGDKSPPFFFQMHAAYDKNDPMCQIYPYMKLQISAPVEVQNLLPYDFKYRIYDKNTKKDWTNFLRKGGVSPVHVVELSHLLLISVDLEDTPFKQSDFAIINSNTQEEFRREKVLNLKDEHGSQLRLKLHYTNIKDSGGAFRVSIYAPYVLLNKTGLEMAVQNKSYFNASRSTFTQATGTTVVDRQKALPYLFSFDKDDRKNRAVLKFGDSAWSKPQSFDAIGSTYEVVVPSSSGRSEFNVGISVKEGEGKYNLCKVVSMSPRFMLKNRIGEDLELREPGSSDVLKLKNNDLLPIYFMKQSQEKQLCLCFPGQNNQWSSPFQLSNVGMTHIKLAKHGQRQKLIRVEIILEDATLFLHFSIETKHWPFSMRNESDTEFLFFQANPNIAEDEEEDQGSGWKPVRYKLPPRSIMPYAWDYPASKNKELVLTSGGRERYVKLAEIGNLIPLKLPRSDGQGIKVIDLNIVADGPTQTLVLSNYNQSQSLYRQKTGQATGSQTSVNHGFEVKNIESDVNFKAELRLAGIGISLVNSNIRELLYLTLREINLKYGDSKLYQTVNATIKWIQIDNQLYGGIFPILLYPSVVPKTGKEMEAHPIFHAAVTRVKDDSYGVLYIKYATLLLQQITIELDEDFIFALLDFTKIPGASWSEEKEGKLCDEHLDVPEPVRQEQGQDIYFELLHLQPIQLDLSFVRTERINAEDTMINNPFMFVVNVMTMSIGNVNDAPIRLNALMLENARLSIPTLMANIQSHYTQEVLRQIHIILGSADFLGNPVGLFNSVSSGVADIFYEPYQGLVMTDRPQDLGIGIAKGASSFVKKSVFGFSDSMAKFSGSISKGLAAATMDKEFQDQRRMSKSRNRPKHALYGVTAGGNAFATSVASGIGGLARHPLEGAEKEGALGFAKGVGKGLLGLATKPAIGAFDLASNVAEGVRNTTTVFDSEGLDRVRLTRFIGMDGVVRPYAQREALGQFWLKTTDDGKYFNEDYIAHFELEGKEMMVMLTYNRILMIRARKLKTEWEVRLTDIQSISKERTGMSIGLKGGSNGPFIPVADEGSRNWLYKQIAIAVNAFNDKYNAKG